MPQISYHRLEASIACHLSLVPFFLLEQREREVCRVWITIVFHHYRRSVEELETFRHCCRTCMRVRAIQPTRLPHMKQSSTPRCSPPSPSPCRSVGTTRTPACLPTLSALRPTPQCLGPQTKRFDPQRPRPHLDTPVFYFWQTQFRIRTFLGSRHRPTIQNDTGSSSTSAFLLATVTFFISARASSSSVSSSEIFQ